MNISIRYFVILVLFLGPISLNAQSSTFTLDEAIGYAVKNHTSIKNAQLDIEIATKKVREVLAIGLPQVSADIKFQNFLQIPTTVIPANAFNPTAPPDDISELQFGTNYNITAGAQLSQLIFNGSYIVGLQASKAFKETSNILMSKTKQDIRKEVSSAYYTVVMLKQNSNALNEQIANINKIYSETMVLVDEGVIEKTSPLQLKLSQIQLNSAIDQIEQQIKVAKILLKMNMGYDMENEISLSENMNIFIDQALSNETDSTINTSQNINNILLNHQLKLDHLNIKNKRSAYLPSLSGYITHQQTAQRNKLDFADTDQSWYPTSIWGLNLNVPIYTSGSTDAQIQQARLKSFKTENEIFLLNDGLRLQYAKALNDYNQSISLYYAQEEMIAISQKILDAANIKYKEGVINSMELTQTQGQLLKAEADLISTSYNILSAKLMLNQLSNKL